MLALRLRDVVETFEAGVGQRDIAPSATLARRPDARRDEHGARDHRSDRDGPNKLVFHGDTAFFTACESNTEPGVLR